MSVHAGKPAPDFKTDAVMPDGLFKTIYRHWALMTLVESSAVRMQARAPSARTPLSPLAKLLRFHERGEQFPRLFSRA